jgi:hypothetical protein
VPQGYPCLWELAKIRVLGSELTADLADLPLVPESQTAENGGPFAVLLFKDVNKRTASTPPNLAVSALAVLGRFSSL